MPPVPVQKVDSAIKQYNRRIIFDDDGKIDSKPKEPSQSTKQKLKKKTFKSNNLLKKEKKSINNNNGAKSDDKDEEYLAKRERQKFKKIETNDEVAARKKWYNVYQKYPCSDEVLDMKESEQMELHNICKSAFQGQMSTFNKRNPSDARWLQTALHRGTAKDRANAGALLVTSNPLGNLEALGSLIGFTKPSNKSSTDVIGILTDLWKEVLLPPYRKLLSLQMRGADWKLLRKDTSLHKDEQKRIYAYWYFESELKDQYFEFLKNLQMGMQAGQENNKNTAIVSASQLLVFAPEKEQMLLTMLINKLGDPIPKIAAKALHHLTAVAHKHPNMCGVIVAESEKLLFRNNISERAQHFALCFLGSIAPAGRPEVCSKLVHICFSLFKVLVQKGAVNNRTMQAILRCLQKAILEAQPVTPGSSDVLSKDMQDTVYRLVHLADIRVSVQTLGLLLQLITLKTEKSDRFYNALYKKMLDLELTNIGMKTASQLLHIIHRAIHIDANVPRAQAFIKRLLQLALYTPPNTTAGCLIVIQKLLRSRKELITTLSSSANNSGENDAALPHVALDDDEVLAKFDSDGEERYEDVHDGNFGKDTDNRNKANAENQLNEEGEENVGDNMNQEACTVASSWHHAKVINMEGSCTKVRDLAASKYDPYHRVPSFAGAELEVHNELLLLREHFHPTVQVFADSILNQNRINYYGDPLRDFNLAHFLERFAFKNPKKVDKEKVERPTLVHKHYVTFGARGKPVKSLTKANCTEDEMYIFNFLEHKRKVAIINTPKKSIEDDTVGKEDDLQPNEVNDDEFEQYLDGFFGKKANAAAEKEEEELDFLNELGGELKADKKVKTNKKTKSVTSEEEGGVADIDADWGDDEEEADFAAGADNSDDEEGSIDLEDDDEDGGSLSLDEDAAGMNDMSEEDLSEPEDESTDEENAESEVDARKAKTKKSITKQVPGLGNKSFAMKLKHSNDMSSLFAAADDFAELLEETGKTKGQGTINAVYNKDKSSNKQMKWEQKRHSNAKDYTKKRGNRFGGGAAAVAMKKRKH